MIGTTTSCPTAWSATVVDFPHYFPLTGPAHGARGYQVALEVYSSLKRRSGATALQLSFTTSGFERVQRQKYISECPPVNSCLLVITRLYQRYSVSKLPPHYKYTLVGGLSANLYFLGGGKVGKPPETDKQRICALRVDSHRYTAWPSFVVGAYMQ